MMRFKWVLALGAGGWLTAQTANYAYNAGVPHPSTWTFC
jgi:hypothetical protein